MEKEITEKIEEIEDSEEQPLIRKIIKNNTNNQKLITVPKTSKLKEGQYVYIIPVPEYKTN